MTCVYRNKTNLLYGLIILYMVYFYYLIPKGADALVIVPCLLIFYFLFFKSLQKPIQVGTVRSFIKIDVLFYSFSYLLYYFPYQKYILGLSSLTTYLPFEDYVEYSNPSIILSTIAMMCFALGYNHNSEKNIITVNNLPKPEILQINKLFVILLILVIPLVIYFFIKNSVEIIYHYSSDITIQANTGYREINWLIMMVGGVLIYYLKFCEKINLMFILGALITVIWSVFLFVSGDRNMFFIQIIILAGGYFTIIKSASRKFLFAAMASALFVYNIVEIARTVDNKSVDTYIVAYELMQDKEQSSFDNTLIGYRFTLDYIPHRHEYFYGKFLLLSISSIVPFLSGQLVRPDDPYTGSGGTITYNLLGADSATGLGTNITSDLYMDFGIVGVILFMFLIGRFAIYIQNKLILNTYSVKWVVIYLMTLALLSEIPRYGLAFPIRDLVWAFLFFSLFVERKFKKSKI